jgi:hypothetical protein
MIQQYDNRSNMKGSILDIFYLYILYVKGPIFVLHRAH